MPHDFVKIASSKHLNVEAPRSVSAQARARMVWLLGSDIVIVSCILYIHTVIKGTPFDTEYRVLLILTALLMVVIYSGLGVYSLMRTAVSRAFSLFKAWSLVIVFIIAAAFITKTSDYFSREVLISWALTGFIAQICISFILSHQKFLAGIDKMPTLIIGTGALAQHLAENIYDNPWIQDDVIGLIGEKRSLVPDISLKIPVLGDVAALEQLIEEHSIERVYVALPVEYSDMIRPICQKISRLGVDVIWAPDIISVNLMDQSTQHLSSIPTISLSEGIPAPILVAAKRLPNRIKRVFDIFVAIFLLVVMAPFLFLAGILIMILEGLPVFYVSVRQISMNKSVKIFKFRTMVRDATSSKYQLKEKYMKDGYLDVPLSDEVYTPIGRILERLQIVEVLQTINILLHGMSFVGNRPLPRENLEQLSQYPGWEKRFDSPAGITGITQVVGKFLLTAEDRLTLECMYSSLYCSPTGNVLLLDVLIILYTAKLILTGQALSLDRAKKLITFANGGNAL